MSLYATLRDWAARLGVHDRVEPLEAEAAERNAIVDIDTRRNAMREVAERDFSTPAPVTPLERLESAPGVVVSRDFRAAGKGAKWDRVREYPARPHGYPLNKKRGQSRGVRRWESIDTIMLHTAAVKLGPDRWLGVPCHGAIASDASVVLCHHADAYLWHGHAANRYSIGIEISGARTIEPPQVEPARALVRYYVELLREHHEAEGVGGKPIKIIPHRHSHSSRGVDCDAAIWRAVGEWAIDTLDLELGPVVGSGRPIPAQWWTPGRQAA